MGRQLTNEEILRGKMEVLDVLDVVIGHINMCDIPGAKQFARHGIMLCKKYRLTGTDVHVMLAIIYATIVSYERWKRYVDISYMYRPRIVTVNVRLIKKYLRKLKEDLEKSIDRNF